MRSIRQQGERTRLVAEWDEDGRLKCDFIEPIISPVEDQTRVRFELEYELRDYGVVARLPLTGAQDDLDRWLDYLSREKTFNPLKRWRVCRTTYEAGEWTDE